MFLFKFLIFYLFINLSKCMESSQENVENTQIPNLNRTIIRKCCPFGQLPFSFNHPEICKISNSTKEFQDSLFQNFTSEHVHELEWKSINCLKYDRKFGSAILLSEISSEFEDLNITTEEYCIDKISSDSEFYFFNCSELWPYDDFVFRFPEKWSMVIPCGISAIFSNLTLLIYLLQLKPNKGNDNFFLKTCYIFSSNLQMTNIVFMLFVEFHPRNHCSTFHDLIVQWWGILFTQSAYWNCILNVTIFQAFWKLRSPVRKTTEKKYFSKKVIKCILIGFVLPVIVGLVSYGLSRYMSPVGHKCAIVKESAKKWFLNSAGGILNLVNIFTFLGTFILIVKIQFEVKSSKENRESGSSEEFKKMLKLFLRLFFLNGVIWIGLFTPMLKFKKDRANDTKVGGVMEGLYNLVLCLQGVILFLLFGLEKGGRKVLKDLCKKSKKSKIGLNSQTSNSAQTQETSITNSKSN